MALYSDPTSSVQPFEASIKGLPPEQQQAIRQATADLLESLVPMLRQLPRGRQTDVLLELSNLLTGLVTQGADHVLKIDAENVPAEVAVHVVVNQLRAGSSPNT